MASSEQVSAAAARERERNSDGAPPGWTVWPTSAQWHARPPVPEGASPDVRDYVHGSTRTEVIAKAWRRAEGR